MCVNFLISKCKEDITTESEETEYHEHNSDYQKPEDLVLSSFQPSFPVLTLQIIWSRDIIPCEVHRE